MSASVLITQVEALISDIAPQALDEAAQLFSDLWQLFPKLPPSSAKGPQWNARMTSNPSAGSFEVGGPLPAPGATSKVPARLPFANYGGTLTIEDKTMEELAVAGGNGTLQLTSYLQDEIEQLAMAQAAKIDTDTITNQNVSKAIVGLHGTNSCINDTGTWASIDRAVYAPWQCAIYDNSGTPRPITTALLNASYGNFVKEVGKAPGQWVILTDDLQANAMSEIVTGAAVAERAVVGTTAEQILGKTATWYKGIPVVPISGFTSGRVDFVNVSNSGYERMTANKMLPTQFVGDTTLFSLVNYLQFRIKNPGHSAFAITDLS